MRTRNSLTELSLALPSVHVNIPEIEDHLRKKMSLSTTDWQALVDTSSRVEIYTKDMSNRARSFAGQDRAARRDNPLSPNTLTIGRATLHGMQMALNSHVQGEIDGLKAGVGQEATKRIEVYLQGPLAASTSVVPFKLRKIMAEKRQTR